MSEEKIGKDTWNFLKIFPFKINVDELNQNFYLKRVSNVQQSFLNVVFVYEITRKRFLKNVEVRSSWNKLIQ